MEETLYLFFFIFWFIFLFNGDEGEKWGTGASCLFVLFENDKIEVLYLLKLYKNILELLLIIIILNEDL